MKETFPAVINFAPESGSVELRDHPAPSIGPDDVLVEVAYAGVCGSDLHQWHATHSWAVNYPIVLGHEFSGRIAEVGAAVRGFQVGDRIVSETAAAIDPDSPLTRRGLYNLDPSRQGFGYGLDGAMTRYVKVPRRCLHHVPAELPLKIAALTEPCCVAYNAVVNNTRLQPGDRVLVLGPGPIGILCAAVAQLQGAEVILKGVKGDGVRLNVARTTYGFRTVEGSAEDLTKGGDGLGFDAVIDAAGVSASLREALELVRPAGWITKVGWGPQPLNFSLDPLVKKNVTLQGSFSHNWPVWERVIELLASRRLIIDPLIGGVWALPDWEDAFVQMQSGKVAKAVMQPTPGID